MNADENTIHEGLALGHAMAEVAANHAGEQWQNEAYEAFRQFALRNEFFTTETVRAAFPDMDAPPDTRAWGAVALRAKKNNVVEAKGWVRAESRSVHGMVVTSWRSKIFQGDV
jgi:hypothetical protein